VDTRTNSSFESKTSSLGAYNFVKLNPGPGYKLTISKDGFETLTVANIYLAVGGTHTKDVQLEVGKVTDVVEVSGAGAAVALNTTDATIGNYFDMRSVQELPVQVRDNPTALLGLQPGVIGAGQSGGSDANFDREGAVTGARADQGNITLDGLDVNDFATGQA